MILKQLPSHILTVNECISTIFCIFVACDKIFVDIGILSFVQPQFLVLLNTVTVDGCISAKLCILITFDKILVGSFVDLPTRS